MCYLVARAVNQIGSIAMPAHIGSEPPRFIDDLESRYGIENLELITISRPSAYGEYEPYSFVRSEAEFDRALEKAARPIRSTSLFW